MSLWYDLGSRLALVAYQNTLACQFQNFWHAEMPIVYLNHANNANLSAKYAQAMINVLSVKIYQHSSNEGCKASNKKMHPQTRKCIPQDQDAKHLTRKCILQDQDATKKCSSQNQDASKEKGIEVVSLMENSTGEKMKRTMIQKQSMNFININKPANNHQSISMIRQIQTPQLFHKDIKINNTHMNIQYQYNKDGIILNLNSLIEISLGDENYDRDLLIYSVKQNTIMKSHRKQISSKRSSREQSKKPTVQPNIKKVSCSIPLKMPTSIPSKSLMLNSYRARNSKPQVKNQAFTSHHSRKLSIQQPTTSRKESQAVLKSKQKTSNHHNNKKEHARSNSTLSKKSFKQTNKNCFKIDLSKLTGTNCKSERENKIIIQQRANANAINDKMEVGRGHFDFEYVVGKGGFGKVWSVEMKKNGQMYAMKEMNKTKIIAKRSIHSVLNERSLLAKLKHPFIVNMSYAFQDREKLYLVMDLLVGGDLRYHMGCRRRFKENEAKFFIACIVIGLEYLHLNNIIHRDIKPENLVFDDGGYLRITDLGIARVMKPNNSSDTSGTPGYMAPEVMCRQDHSFPVDYYAVGIIAYELMLGKRPYNGRNRRQIREAIISKQVQIKAEQIPNGWSPQAANFINKLIQRKVNHRLGSQSGSIEIKQHPWFRGFPWGQLLKKSLHSPFIPQNILGSEDYREQISETSQDENQQQNLLLLRKDEVKQAFSEYEYYCRQAHKSSTVQKKLTKNSATTANTHGSYISDKQKQISSRTNGKKCSHNFFKM